MTKPIDGQDTSSRRDDSSPSPRTTVPMLRILGFVVVGALWLTFGAAVLLSQSSLDAAWHAFRAAPVPVQVLEGVLLLPWVLGLAVWQARWVLWLRVLLVAGLVWTSLYMFFPRRSR